MNRILFILSFNFIRNYFREEDSIKISNS